MKKSNRRAFMKASLMAAGSMATMPIIQTCSNSIRNYSKPTDEYDLAIYGATPGGIACAVRAAREGLKVLLISYNNRLGGMLTNGLGVWDTLYEGYRSPIYNELRQTFFDYYKNTYGENSASYKRAMPGKTGHNNGTFEAHVAEMFINELVNKETNISVLYNHYPTAVDFKDRVIKKLTLKKMDGTDSETITADYFADCSYEGDLMAIAKVKYRVGREAKDEFNEKHAGKIYMDPKGESVWSEREERVFTKLNFRHFGHHQNVIYPESTHEGDDKVQAFNMRYYVTDDSNNQIEIKPSENYDPAYLKTLEFQGNPTGVIKPNSKFGLNRPQLVGLHNKYVEGDWQTRREVVKEHIRITRDMIYWVQNDPDAPKNWKKNWKGWGLAADEFVDNNNDPYDIYVREARRMVSKLVYTENDLALHPEYERTPIYHDSIGIVEWYQDCHACTSERIKDKGSIDEGKMMIHKETFIGQFPYRAIVPNEIDNLLVPVCVSSTHVAWGAIRLEPTWMQLGESAAYAILQSRKEQVKLPAINTEKLVQTLVQKQSLLSFFNDFYIDAKEDWVPAIQYFGTKGFFPEYDAYPNQPLDRHTAQKWIRGFLQLKAGNLDENQVAVSLINVNRQDIISANEFNAILEKNGIEKIQEEKLTRGKVCFHLYNQIA